MKISLKKEHIYTSSLLLKFLNNFIFVNLKLKMEKLIYLAFFYWKKHSNFMPLFFFFECLLKIRPILGFYLYIIKRKKIKKIKITPFFMSFENRWKKAVYWITRAIKIDRGKNTLPLLISHELYNIMFFETSLSFIQKSKHYKTLMVYKTSKNFIW